MFKFLIIGAIIVIAILLLARRFGGPRVTPQPTNRTPPLITSGGATAAEIDGQELDIDPEVMAEVRALIAAGQKIQAIKLMREATGLGLTEAKEVVDSLERINK